MATLSICLCTQCTAHCLVYNATRWPIFSQGAHGAFFLKATFLFFCFLFVFFSSFFWMKFAKQCVYGVPLSIKMGSKWVKTEKLFWHRGVICLWRKKPQLFRSFEWTPYQRGVSLKFVYMVYINEFRRKISAFEMRMCILSMCTLYAISTSIAEGMLSLMHR